MLPPDEVTVLTAADNEAQVYYETPAPLRELWNQKRYTLTRLRKIAGRWVITESATLDAPP
jgi:hypothetical protein